MKHFALVDHLKKRENAKDYKSSRKMHTLQHVQRSFVVWKLYKMQICPNLHKSVCVRVCAAAFDRAAWIISCPKGSHKKWWGVYVTELLNVFIITKCLGENPLLCPFKGFYINFTKNPFNFVYIYTLLGNSCLIRSKLYDFMLHHCVKERDSQLWSM